MTVGHPLWGNSSTEPDLTRNKRDGTVTGTLNKVDGPPIASMFSHRRPLVYMPAAGGTAYTKALSGGGSFAGAVVRKTGKAVAGVESFVGAAAKKTARLLSGAETFTGATAKKMARALGGQESFAGVVVAVKVMHKAVVGVASFAGAVARVFTAGGAAFRKLIDTITTHRSREQ